MNRSAFRGGVGSGRALRGTLLAFLIGVLGLGTFTSSTRADDRSGDAYLQELLNQIEAARKFAKEKGVLATLGEARDAAVRALKGTDHSKEAIGEIQKTRKLLQAVLDSSGKSGTEFVGHLSKALSLADAYLTPVPAPKKPDPPLGPPPPKNPPPNFPPVSGPQPPEPPKLPVPQAPIGVPPVIPRDTPLGRLPVLGILISEEAAAVDCIHFAQDEHFVYLLWRERSGVDLTEGAIRLAASADGGRTFGFPTTVHASHVAGHRYLQESRSAQIAVGGGFVWVSWFEGLQFSVLEGREGGRGFLADPFTLTISGDADRSSVDTDGRSEMCYTDGGLIVVSTEIDPATMKDQVFVRRFEAPPGERRWLAERVGAPLFLGRRDLPNALATPRCRGPLVRVAFMECLFLQEHGNLMLSESRDGGRTWRTIARGEGVSGLNRDPIHNSAVGDRAKCLGPTVWTGSYDGIAPDFADADLEMILHMPTAAHDYQPVVTYAVDPAVGLFGGRAQEVRFAANPERGASHAPVDSSERAGRTSSALPHRNPFDAQMAGNRPFWMESDTGHPLRIFSTILGARGAPASEGDMPAMFGPVALAVGDSHVVLVANGEQALWRRVRNGEPVGSWTPLVEGGGAIHRLAAVALGSSFLVAWHQGTTFRCRRIDP